MEKKKVGFASGIGFILAAAGSAVGLGNLWGFPYKTSQNGGAAFVLIYIACVLLIGFVTMLSEIYLGRRAQANPMTAYKMVNKNLGWCGLVAIMIPAFIICYYSVLGGWTTKYALSSFSGNAGIVGTFSVNTGEVILYTAIFLVLSMMIIMGGVKDGIEKASKVLMPVLFLILVAIAVYALTLGSGGVLPIMTLGPIGIHPGYKRQGYGKALLDFTLEKAAAMGFGAVCFEGNIDFYGKSGFTFASAYNIRYHGLPEGEDASFFLCKALKKGFLDGVKGEYATPRGYFVDEAEAEEFDRQFPEKEKLVLPGQLFS